MITQSTKATPIQNVETTQVLDPLGSFVDQRYQKARIGRLNIDAILVECLEQRKGIYSATELQGMGRIATFLKHTETKCGAGESWINDVLASTQGRPFTLNPTPEPEIPEFIREAIIEQVKGELMAAGIVNFDVKARMRELRDLAKKYIFDYSKKAADKMSVRIEDSLVQDKFEDTLKAFISDVITYPYAVLKGPIVTMDRQLTWVKNKPVVKEVPRLTSVRVSPFDYYWAPWATKPSEGYSIEMMHVTANDLIKYRDKKGFNKANIEKLIYTIPQGFNEPDNVQYQKQILETNMNTINANYNRDGVFDVLNYWGDAPGYELKKFGVQVDDELENYQVNIWACGGSTLFAMINPHPLGHSPFKVTSYRKLPGALVGNSVPMLMKPYQEVINSAIRALRRNMGLASGPFAEVDQSRLAGDTPPEEIAPLMVKLVEPDMTGSGQPVYRFHDIPSNAQELDAILEKQMRYCDDATGIPAYTYGNPGVSGAGRTVGGLAILMGNASKGIKQVIANIETDILQPLIQDYFVYNMLFDPDESIKCDAQVVVRGPSGVIMKEAGIQKRLEGLQIITPFLKLIDPKGIQIILREILGGLDFPVDDIIPDPNRAGMIAQATGIPPPNGQPGTPMQVPPQSLPNMQPPQAGQGTIPTPVIDGRSGPANMITG